VQQIRRFSVVLLLLLRGDRSAEKAVSPRQTTNRQSTIRALSGIRTRDPNKQAAADLRLRSRERQDARSRSRNFKLRSLTLKHPVGRSTLNGNQVSSAWREVTQWCQEDASNDSRLAAEYKFLFLQFSFSKRHILLILPSPKVFCSPNAASTLASACSYISNSPRTPMKPDTQWCVTERNGTLANCFPPSQWIHSVVAPPTLTYLIIFVRFWIYMNCITSRNIMYRIMIYISSVQKVLI
jgi:hypothetical protein